MEEQFYEYADGSESFLSETEIRQILADYRRQQAVENMVGPGVSFVIHIIVLSLMFVFIATKPKQIESPIEYQIVKVEPIELDDEVKDELDEIEDPVEDSDNPPTEVVEAPATDQPGDSSLDDYSDEAPMTEDNADLTEVVDFVSTQSVLQVPLPIGGRSNEGRKRKLKEHGANPIGQRKLGKSLNWLARVQNTDGSWSDHRFRQAHTGLALLVFLAHGETPLSEQYGTTVQNAIRWLCNYANSSDLRKRAFARHGAYAHGIATYSLCEAYAMTKIPMVKVAMEKAVDIVIDGQQSNGGFDYAYAKNARWDLSVSGWNYQALKAARMAGSTNERLSSAIKRSIRFCQSTAYVKGGSNAGFGYANNGGGRAASAGRNMYGVGVVSLQLMGAGSSKQVKQVMNSIYGIRHNMYLEVKERPASWEKVAGDNLYGWYYDTQAVFNSQNTAAGKKKWHDWRRTFEEVLIRSQDPEGYWQTANKNWGPTLQGRILATSFCCLQLEVYYRYLPSFNRDKMDATAKQAGDTIDDIGAGLDGVFIDGV